MLRFENIAHNGRAAAIVGDAAERIFGKLVEPYRSMAIRVNVTDQPAGSTIFNGLGTSGTNLTFADLASATFAVTGFYQFTVDCGAGTPPIVLQVACFPAAALNVTAVRGRVVDAWGAGRDDRTDQERRFILRNIAQRSTQVQLETKLENSPAAPYYGTDASGTNFIQVGGS